MIPTESTYTVLNYHGHTLPDQYRNLVYSKWMRSLRYGNEYFKLIDSEVYYSVYHQFITTVLNVPLCVVRLAVVSDDDDTVLGFSVSRGSVLDYVHVHKDQRRQGIAKSLCKDFDTVTHMTKTGLTLWSSHFPTVKFNPFI